MTDDKTMTVERFDPEISCGPPCVGVMEPAAAGEYVRYADYQAALQARDAEATERVRRAELRAAAYAREADRRIEQAEAECARLRSALAHIVAVLGPNVPASVTSSGARYEWADALGTAEDALTPHVEPVGINAGGDAEGGGA